MAACTRYAPCSSSDVFQGGVSSRGFKVGGDLFAQEDPHILESRIATPVGCLGLVSRGEQLLRRAFSHHRHGMALPIQHPFQATKDASLTLQVCRDLRDQNQVNVC